MHEHEHGAINIQMNFTLFKMQIQVFHTKHVEGSITLLWSCHLIRK